MVCATNRAKLEAGKIELGYKAFAQFLKQAKPAPEFVHHKKYWVIQGKRKQTFITSFGQDDRKEYLMIFSAKSKAEAFLKSIKKKRKNFDIFSLTWDEILKTFMGWYQFAGLDSHGTDESFIILRIPE